MTASFTNSGGQPIGFAAWRHNRLDDSWSIIATDGYPYTPEEFTALIHEQTHERRTAPWPRVRVEVRQDTQHRSWRLHAREYGALTWVFNKTDIPAAARRIIQRCGTHPQDFQVDLVFGEPFPVYEC